jgi:hypothetical protein
VNSTTSPGKRNPSERSRRTGSPDERPPHSVKKGVKNETKSQGNL